MRSSPDAPHPPRNRSARPAGTIEDVYRRYGVPYQVTRARGVWTSTHCPHCAGSAGYHLGFGERGFFCWRCGPHPAVETLMALCHVDRRTAGDIYASIRGGESRRRLAPRDDRAANARVSISRYRHPSDVGKMRDAHRRYLQGRGFDPDAIEREWGVLSTGPASYLDEISYRHRLLIPVRWDGAEVSFQARDVTGRSDRKYMACPPEREVRSHKTLLYGRQECWGDVAVIVEGVTDVWKLGSKACAVFGIQYRTEQVVEIARRFRRAMVVFDPEPAARRQADRLADQLRVRLSGGAEVVDLRKMGIDASDPGSMTRDDAEHLMRELTR